ncbi:MAG: L,D-transpeptidase family protein [Planctomycetes bacterium]|nr:L,D-transpeptidase family protein [Planctomycetota bacterium]
MARWYSGLIGLRSGGVFVILVVVAFGAVVFLLFRGHSSGPQEAAASAAPPVSASANTANDSPSGPVAATGSDPAPASGQEQNLLAGAPQPSTGAASGQATEADAAIADAVKLIHSQPADIIEARNRLNKLLQGQITPEQRRSIKDEMAKLSKDWLFGPAAYPGDMLCDTYTVRRGDLLDILGRRMKVPHEILMQINNIAKPQALQAGRALKMIHGPFNVKISRSAFTLDLYLQDMYVRSFKVGLGKAGFETPLGHWHVAQGGKLTKPTWTDPDTGRQYKSTDPDYPLGSRWIGLEGVDGAARGRTGFAIHGTKEPDQIGTAGSRGCIRMYNDDVVLMYSLLVPQYSQVDTVE